MKKRWVIVPGLILLLLVIGIVVVTNNNNDHSQLSTEEPTEKAVALPELRISRWSMDMPGYDGRCVKEYRPMVTEVCIENVGAVDSGEVVIRLGQQIQTIDELSIGEEVCLSVNGAPGTAVVDPDNMIDESDEGNNTLLLPIPTPPAICTDVP